MDVRRLLARLRTLLLDSGAALDSPSAALASIGSAHPHQERSAGGSQRPANAKRAHKASVANWLADGRRVRLHVRPSTRLGGELDEWGSENYLASRDRVDRQGAMYPAPARVTAPREPVAQSSPTPSTPTTDGARSRVASGPASPLPALPPDIHVDFTGELSAATLAAIEQLDATQRRLIFLRYLVEQGVYNEGFGGSPLPEQYWRSRGRGEHPSE